MFEKINCCLEYLCYIFITVSLFMLISVGPISIFSFLCHPPPQRRPQEEPLDGPPALKSPLQVLTPLRASEEVGLDTFSHHFESIVESHRTKGTSYNSLDGASQSSSCDPTGLTMDPPTLMPDLPGRCFQSAQQIVQLAFAPLAHGELGASQSESSDATRAPSSERLSSEDAPSLGSLGPTESWAANGLVYRSALTNHDLRT